MTVESTGFKASDVLAGNLQKVLTDVTALSLVGKQLHWNITGEGFRSLHLYLDEVVDIAREASDEVAERMRALQVVPNGLPEVVAQRNTLPTVPETIIKTSDAEEARRRRHQRDRRHHARRAREGRRRGLRLRRHPQRLHPPPRAAGVVHPFAERPGLSLTPP